MATVEESMTDSMTIMVIGANLEEGTEIRAAYEIFGAPFPARTLNASIMYEYESGPRETDVLI